MRHRDVYLVEEGWSPEARAAALAARRAHMKPKEAPKPRRAKAEEPTKPRRAKAEEPKKVRVEAVRAAPKPRRRAKAKVKEPHVRAQEAAGRLGMRPATDEDRKRLKVPPAWKHVHVHDDPEHRTPALGVDDVGRVVRQRSEKFAVGQAAAKFEKIGGFHAVLPNIDKTIAAGLKAHDENAVALMLARRLGTRIGGTADTGAKRKAHGATTLLVRHVKIDGDQVTLSFIGKSGHRNRSRVIDPEMARALEHHMASKDGADQLLPNATDAKARKLMAEVAPGFTPRDFRTHLGTATAARLVSEMRPPKNKKEHDTKRKLVGQKVSEVLNNTPSVALGSYIAPDVFSEWDHALDVPAPVKRKKAPRRRVTVTPRTAVA